VLRGAESYEPARSVVCGWRVPASAACDAWIVAWWQTLKRHYMFRYMHHMYIWCAVLTFLRVGAIFLFLCFFEVSLVARCTCLHGAAWPPPGSADVGAGLSVMVLACRSWCRLVCHGAGSLVMVLACQSWCWLASHGAGLPVMVRAGQSCCWLASPGAGG
jgi:hypothetical protein